MVSIDSNLYQQKSALLDYFRHRAAEFLHEIRESYGESQYKKRAASVNRALLAERDSLERLVRQKAAKESWEPSLILQTRLLLMHTSNVVMLESRNDVWPYDYMAFSRRIGELWEPLCTACFDPPARTDVELFVPPLFDEVRTRMQSEVKGFIHSLPLETAHKEQLLAYYDKVWLLVTSGEIKLALDLHFTLGDVKFVVDFKSGFGSNEKGNTNRLLLVASVYRHVEHDPYRCLLLVRSSEDASNHYLQTLKSSGLWEVSCGPEAYQRIHELSGFDLATWMQQHVTWQQDFRQDVWAFLAEQKLTTYLAW